MQIGKSDHEIVQYTDEGLANGDPIVVYDPESGESNCLGTGFSNFRVLRDHLEVSVMHGRSTNLITEDNAEWLEGKGPLEVFTVAGKFKHKED